jgi:protease I
MKGWVLLVLLAILLVGCTIQPSIPTEEAEPIQTRGEIMGKVLFIIAQMNYRDEELLTPKQILENSGYECDVASITADPATGMLGGVVKPDLAVHSVDLKD